MATSAASQFTNNSPPVHTKQQELYRTLTFLKLQTWDLTTKLKEVRKAELPKVSIQPQIKRIAIVYPFEKGNPRCSPDVQEVYENYAHTIFGSNISVQHHYCPLKDTRALPEHLCIDGVIISGSPDNVSNPSDCRGLDEFNTFVQKLFIGSIPTVGVCWGFQEISHALGGKVTRGNKLHLGIEKMYTPQNILKRAKKPILYAYVAHSDEVVTLPNSAIPLLKSPEGHHQLAVFGPEMIGFQFHTEYNEEDVLPRLDYLSGMLSQQSSEVKPTIAGPPNHKFINTEMVSNFMRKESMTKYKEDLQYKATKIVVDYDSEESEEALVKELFESHLGIGAKHQKTIVETY